MKYYIKQALFPFFYILLMAITALGILVINGLTWLKVILAILNIGLYALVIATVSYKEGQESVKVQHANDLERREIIRTGEDRPLKIHEEYKPWKGAVFGLLACAPLIILLILHTILHLAGGGNGFGAAAGISYLMFYVFFVLDVPMGSSAEAVAETSTVAWYASYGALIAIPVIVAITGIFYYLGAKKILLQQESIREKQRQIYGEDA